MGSPGIDPIMFMLLVAGGALLALGAQWRERLYAWHLVVVAGLVWIAFCLHLALFFFWRTGTGDYGYSLVWATLFLCPTACGPTGPTFSSAGGALCVCGHSGGLSNENVGMLAILTALSVAVFRWRASGRVHLWAIAGILARRLAGA